MRRHAFRLGALALGTLAFLSASSANRARADGIDLNRYAAAETVFDGFALSRPDDLGDGRFGINLHLDYANDPLVLELRSGSSGSELASVVSDELVAHMNLALGLWSRLIVFGGVDAILLMKGDEYVDPATDATTRTADGTGLGDGRLGGRVRLAGEREDLASIALQLTLTLPLGGAVATNQNYSGEESATFLPELLFELRPGPVRLTLNLGSRLRKDADLDGAGALKDELVYGLGATIPLASDVVDLHLEGYGSTSFADFGDREATPFEGLGGFKVWPDKHWALGIAAGTGIVRGVGSPDFRIVGSFGWATPEEEEAPPPKAKRRAPKPTPTDRDGDGLLDKNDKCPDEAEDDDDYQDNDGCPDPDNDADGVVDDDDKCPMDPEDKDEFADDDGCPDRDNDHDGVLDDDDKCPVVPGPKSEQGCPGRVRVEKGMIVILERVEFAVNKDIILEKSEPLLSEVRDTIAANPQIKLIRVEGHTDDRGKDAYNMDLSSRRARSVARWLRDHGVEEDRLEAYGCGETNPIESNDDEAGRQTNRRVEFHIIDPAPDGGPRSAVYCEPLAL
jgi:outer membrane protein OmpA-like peptidoglycan-associated protein